ncbi:MAG: LysR family transcriptional regulator [Deltaproteobacteria bacterium]|nr:LysR family transcriptional regulator [Deltaproteobacteria bacterium]MBW2420235.1 LysR family transcriptional regulator [Deltaproteobacteria bacterium]
MDKLFEFESFSQVATRGSFTAAAEALGVTPSAVSKQVKALEERLGVRLLNRTTRRVSPTEAGRAFHERIQAVLHDVSEAEQAATQLQAEPRGTLRVGAPMDFGRAHLAEPIARFAGEHPDLELQVDFQDRFVDVVDEGFDVVVRIGALPDSSLVARTLAPCRRVLCASPDYLARKGTPRSGRDLLAHTRIGYAYELERSWSFEGAQRISVPIRHRSNNGELTRQLLLAGLGIALLPTFLVSEDLLAGRLQSLPVAGLEADIAIHALYPHRRHLSAKVRHFVDYLTAHCGPRPYWDDGLDELLGDSGATNPE